MYKFKEKMFREPFAPYFEHYLGHIFELYDVMEEDPEHVSVYCITDPTVKVIGWIHKDYLVEYPGFIECDTCRAKLGAPVLCSGCLHNRTLINDLFGSLNDLR